MPADDDLLTINDRFYEAFARASMETMTRIWSNTTTVTCIHPGWPALNGRDDVLKSWAQIFDSGRVQISISEIKVYRYGKLAYVTCCEHLSSNTLSATNIFLRDDQNWRMIHHQAGPSSPMHHAHVRDTHPTLQ